MAEASRVHLHQVALSVHDLDAFGFVEDDGAQVGLALHQLVCATVRSVTLAWEMTTQLALAFCRGETIILNQRCSVSEWQGYSTLKPRQGAGHHRLNAREHLGCHRASGAPVLAVRRQTSRYLLPTSVWLAGTPDGVGFSCESVARAH